MSPMFSLTLSFVLFVTRSRSNKIDFIRQFLLSLDTEYPRCAASPCITLPCLLHPFHFCVLATPVGAVRHAQIPLASCGHAGCCVFDALPGSVSLPASARGIHFYDPSGICHFMIDAFMHQDHKVLYTCAVLIFVTAFRF